MFEKIDNGGKIALARKERGMSEQLDFGDGTWEQAAPVIRMTLENLDHTVNGNGKPGVKADVAEIKIMLQVLMSTSKAYLKGIAWMLGFAIAAAGVYVAYLQINHRVSSAEPPAAESSHKEVPQTAVKE